MSRKNIISLGCLAGLLWGLLTNSAAAGPRSQIPYTLRAIQESWNQGTLLAPWVLGIFAVVLGGLFLWGLINQLRLWPIRPRKYHHPQRLFRDLLDTLDLAENEKKLLRQMTRGARLKHPAMSVLSPSLLNWTKQLWLEEKGARIDSQTLSQIDTIGWKLFSGQPARPLTQQIDPAAANNYQTGTASRGPQKAVMVELQEPVAQENP